MHVLVLLLFFSNLLFADETCPPPPIPPERNIGQLGNTLAQGLLYGLSSPASSISFSVHCDKIMVTSAHRERGDRILLNAQPVVEIVDYPSSNLYQCIKANMKILSIVEFGSLQYGFSRKIMNLMTDRKVLSYLNDLDKKMKNKTLPPLNLWTYTLNHPAVAGSKEKAFELLGILFADPVHQRNLGIIPAGPAKELLKKLGKNIYEAVGKGEIEPYPPGIAGQKNQSLYHFYTIGYVARELTNRDIDPGMAYLTSTMANYRYETLMGFDPEKKLSQNDTEDVYLGYAGALYAIDEETMIQPFSQYNSEALAGNSVYNFVKQASMIDRTQY